MLFTNTKSVVEACACCLKDHMLFGRRKQRNYSTNQLGLVEPVNYTAVQLAGFLFVKDVMIWNLNVAIVGCFQVDVIKIKGVENEK